MPFVLGLGLALTAACGGEAVPDEQAAIDREMDLAMQDTAAEPELRDEGQEPAMEAEETPSRAAPTPDRPPPPPPPPPAATPSREVAEEAEEAARDMTEPEPTEPATMTVTAPAGETFRVRLRQKLSTRDNRPGDVFTAELIDPLIGGRYVVMPSGTPLRGEVTAVQKSGGQGEPAVIKIDFGELLYMGGTYPVTVTVIDADPETEGRYTTGDKAARIGGGAGAGAIIGAIIGKGKGAVIGAAIGAAAGTAITLATEDVDAVLPAGSVLTLRLDEPFSIEVLDRSMGGP